MQTRSAVRAILILSPLLLALTAGRSPADGDATSANTAAVAPPPAAAAVPPTTGTLAERRDALKAQLQKAVDQHNQLQTQLQQTDTVIQRLQGAVAALTEFAPEPAGSAPQ